MLSLRRVRCRFSLIISREDAIPVSVLFVEIEEESRAGIDGFVRIEAFIDGSQMRVVILFYHSSQHLSMRMISTGRMRFSRDLQAVCPSHARLKHQESCSCIAAVVEFKWIAVAFLHDQPSKDTFLETVFFFSIGDSVRITYRTEISSFCCKTAW